jgi:uncharacterized protein YjeT (DUF2065 family)
MNRTRLSLFYVASYLWGGGIGLFLLPQFSATLFQSNAHYPDVMLRGIGMFMIALGVIVVQLIRHRVEVLYPTTIIVRLFICISLFAFYFIGRDPFFLVLLAIVGLGVLLTGFSYFKDRENIAR